MGASGGRYGGGAGGARSTNNPGGLGARGIIKITYKGLDNVEEEDGDNAFTSANIVAVAFAEPSPASASALTIPAATQAGDLLILSYFGLGPTLGSPPTISTPSGWTQVGSYAMTGSNPTAGAIFAKVATGADASASIPHSMTGDLRTNTRSVTVVRMSSPVNSFVSGGWGYDYDDTQSTATALIDATYAVGSVLVFGHSNSTAHAAANFSPPATDSFEWAGNIHTAIVEYIKLFPKQPLDCSVSSLNPIGLDSVAMGCFFILS